MANGQKGDALQVVYGMVVGGLMSAFVGAAVFTAFISGSDSYPPPISAALIGLACAVLMMAGGVYLSERMSWIGTALLFGSGFTALWSASLSFTGSQRWVTLLALGFATALGVVMGWWRFGRTHTAKPAASAAAPRAESAPPTDGEPRE